MMFVDKRRMCPNCRAFISADDRVCPYCDMKLGQRPAVRRESSDLIAGFIPHAGFTTFVILLLNLGLIRSHSGRQYAAWARTTRC